MTSQLFLSSQMHLDRSRETISGSVEKAVGKYNC